jgi:hypothetical protein
MMIFLILSSCSSTYKNLTAVSTPDAGCIKKFKPQFTRALYNTQVNILKSHLSGILFIKQMPDSSTRLVFSTETGFKFFDFEFDKQGLFTVHYILDKMNRKPVIHKLEDDFSLLLMNRLDIKKGQAFKKDKKVYHRFPDGNDMKYFVTDSLCSVLSGAEKSSGRKASSSLIYTGFTGTIPDSVYIDHAGIKFNIALKRLEAVENNN